ncbi:MAG: 7-carboxy-7-deazaguanine synthase, partial [Bacteroidota bacterium]
ERFQDWSFQHFFLQPMDSPQQAENTRLCLDYCLKNPQWRLSVQTHKFLDIP